MFLPRFLALNSRIIGPATGPSVESVIQFTPVRLNVFDRYASCSFIKSFILCLNCLLPVLIRQIFPVSGSLAFISPAFGIFFLPDQIR